MANQTYVPKPYIGQSDAVFRGNLSNDMQLVFRSLNDIDKAFQQTVTNGTVAASYAFAKLPTGSLGAVAVVTDSTVFTWGTAITVGGGTHKVLAWFNGTHWTVLGI